MTYKNYLFGFSTLHPTHRSTMRNVVIILLILAIAQFIAWLVPTPADATGITGYLPLHALFETASIVVAMLVFTVSWNSHSRAQSGNMIILACVFFAIAWIDFSHTIAYKGMPEFVTSNDAQKQLNFWLTARFLAAASLLVVAIRPWRPFASSTTRYILMGALVGLTILLNWGVLFHQEVFPDTFIPGQGLTPLKKNLEYLFIFLNLITALVLWKKMQTEQSFNAALLFGAVCTMAMSEFFFTLYTTMTGAYNVMGHVYKIISYAFIYRAIVVEGIEEPYRKLSQVQQDLTLAIHASNTGLWNWNINTNEVYFSPEWKAQLGYAAHELENNFTTWESLLHPDDHDEALRVVDEFMKAHAAIYQNEFRMRHRDGSYRWILTRGESQFDKDGEMTHLLGSHIDITERKAAEIALKDTDARWKFAVEGANDGVWDWDLQTNAMQFSKLYMSMLGYEENELPRHVNTWIESVHPEDMPDVQQNLQGYLAGRESSYRVELRLRCKDGNYKWILCRGMVASRDAEGKPTRMVGIHTDITEQKNATIELSLHREHLEGLVAERTNALTIAKEAAEAANRAKSTFLANMSHELRTPMNGIMGMTELALRRATDPKQIDQLNKVTQSSEHLLAVINDILDLSKIEAEKLSLDSTEFKLGSVLENMRSMIQQRADDKGLVLDINVESRYTKLMLKGDPLRLGQVLLNLISNAVKFTKQGAVSVRLQMMEENSTSVLLKFEVSDTGIGITTEAQQKLFAAFEQADNSTTRKYGGTGLGLVISKRLVQLMGGNIGVESVVGVGSTFWFSARIDKNESLANTVIAPEELSAENQLKTRYVGARILLVEDEPINQEVSQFLLEDMGLIVDLAENGEVAVEMAQRNHYDLILMDMQMPKMNGTDATKLIRAMLHRKTTPILAMTANAFDENREECLAAGMNDHIGKPVMPAVLYAKLLRWLDEPLPTL